MPANSVRKNFSSQSEISIEFPVPVVPLLPVKPTAVIWRVKLSFSNGIPYLEIESLSLEVRFEREYVVDRLSNGVPIFAYA